MNITSSISNRNARQSVQRLSDELVAQRPKLPNNVYPQEIYHPYGENPPYEHFIRQENEEVLSLLKASEEVSLTELSELKSREAGGLERKSNLLTVSGLVVGGMAVGLFSIGQTLPGALGLASALALGGYAASVSRQAGEVQSESRLLTMWDSGLKNPGAARNPVKVSVRNFREVFEHERERL